MSRTQPRAMALLFAIFSGLLTQSCSDQHEPRRAASVEMPVVDVSRYANEYLLDSVARKVRTIEGGVLIQSRVATPYDESLIVTRYVPSGSMFYMECSYEVTATFESGEELVKLDFFDVLDERDNAWRPSGSGEVLAQTLSPEVCALAEALLVDSGFRLGSMQEVMMKSASNARR